MKEIIEDSWRLFINNIYLLVVLTVPFLVAKYAVDILVMKFEFPIYIMLITKLIIQSLYDSVLILFLSQALYKSIKPLKEIVFNGIVYSPYIFIFYLIVFVPYLLIISVGYIVKLLSPGLLIASTLIVICIWIKLVFSSFLIVLENNKPIEAIKNSFRYTNGYVLKIISLPLVFLVPILLLGKVITNTLSTMSVNPMAIYVVNGLVIGFLMLLVQIVFFKIYCLNYFERQKLLNE